MNVGLNRVVKLGQSRRGEAAGSRGLSSTSHPREVAARLSAVRPCAWQPGFDTRGSISEVDLLNPSLQPRRSLTSSSEWGGEKLG